MTFRNSILAGEDLVRTAIRSPNYIAGVQGWRIARDGSAEFANAVIRGELLVGTPVVGPYIWIRQDAGNPVIQLLPDDPGNDYTPGSIFADIDGLDTPLLAVASPFFTGQDVARLNLFGANSADGIRASAVFDVGDGELTQIQASDVGVIGGGYRRDASNTASSAAVGAETVVLTIANMVFRDGRAYRVTYGNGAQGSASPTDAQFRLRETNAAGTIYGNGLRMTMPVAANTYQAHGHWFLRRNFGAGDLTTDVVLTLQGLGGNATHRASADNPRHLLIEDIGSADAYQFAFSVT